jgi:phosphoribosylformylglycinamidine (FGAM) synthase PurS component
MPITRYVEVVLTIPDNEAETALTTLRRLGVHVDRLQRADLYRFELDPGSDETLLASLRRIETIYNPNKHALEVRAGAVPQAGEVWIGEPGAPVNPAGASTGDAVRVAGRALLGVLKLERLVAWRLYDTEGKPASPEVVARATETLLCNPAFQTFQY